MTVQEKINELILEFSPCVNPYMGSGMLTNTIDDDAILWQAKKCALIVAKEMLSNIEKTNPKWKFWNDVKLKIES